MNSENSRTSEYHVLVLKLAYKLDLRKGQKSVALSNLSIYYTWKNVINNNKIIIISLKCNNKFKISTQRGLKKLYYQNGSYSMSDIHDHAEYILKKHGQAVDDPSIRIYVNKIGNRITFKTKNGYYLELLTPDTMKLFGSNESKINKDKNGEDVPHLKAVELVLVHCDIQLYSRIQYTFVPNKPFDSLKLQLQTISF